MVAKTGTAKGCGVVGNVPWGDDEFGLVVGEYAEEGVGVVLDLSEERRGPCHERARSVEVKELIYIGCKKVGDGWLGTGTNEGALCFAVVDSGGEALELELVFLIFGKKEFSGEGFAANWKIKDDGVYLYGTMYIYQRTTVSSVFLLLFDHILIESCHLIVLSRLVIGVLLIASTSSFLAPNAKQS